MEPSPLHPAHVVALILLQRELSRPPARDRRRD